MTSPRDYYKILQISPKADPAIIKAAYYICLRTLKTHPDLGGSHDDAVLVNEAYEILGDPLKRQEYDNKYFKGLVSHASSPVKNPFAPNNELRRHPRAIFQNSFRLKRDNDATWQHSWFCDISLKGACFRTFYRLSAGDILYLDVCDIPMVRPLAVIRWVRILPQRFGSPIYEGGLEFDKVDEVAFRQYLKNVGLERIAG